MLHLAIVQHTYASTKLTPGLWALAARSRAAGTWTEIRDIGKRLALEGFHKYGKSKLTADVAPAAPGAAAAADPARVGPPPVVIASPPTSAPPSDATQIDVSDT